MADKKPSQLERISSEVHDAWVEWTKHIQRRVKPVWRERWKKLFVDYDELPEFEKAKDRKFARRIQKVIKSGAEEQEKMRKKSYELGRALVVAAMTKQSDDYAEVPEAYAHELGEDLELPQDVPLVQFREGIAIEDEEHGGDMGPHTDITGGSRRRAGQIALGHLREDPNYYTKLERMEGRPEAANQLADLSRSPGKGEREEKMGSFAYELGCAIVKEALPRLPWNMGRGVVSPGLSGALDALKNMWGHRRSVQGTVRDLRSLSPNIKKALPPRTVAGGDLLAQQDKLREQIKRLLDVARTEKAYMVHGNMGETSTGVQRATKDLGQKLDMYDKGLTSVFTAK